MKKSYAQLLVPLVCLGLVSCNEQVAPELQSAGSTTVSSTTVTPSEYYFKITNNSASVLGYHLHKSGAGNGAKDCQITKGTALTQSDYASEGAISDFSQKTLDIACFFEAEELSMYFNGISFNVEASPNTCEYVGYSPYSFYNYKPGATSAQFIGIKCGEGVGAAELATLNATLLTIGAQVSGTAINCGEMVDALNSTASKAAIQIPEDYGDMCKFDYTESDGPNCDVGKFTYQIYEVNLDEDDNPQITLGVLPTKFECGGTVRSCIGGAINHVSTLANATKGTEIINSESNEKFTKTYDLPALIEKQRGYSIDIVNFRRGLAHPDYDYVDYSSDSNWGVDLSNLSKFDPNVLERYAANKNFDNTTMISAGDITAETFSGPYKATPYAAEPFVGTAYRVSPFYTFYCFDRAFDIKARIRMAIRDWDRVFDASSNTSLFEQITDMHQGLTGGARQDLASSEEENTNDPAEFNFYNDLSDWDNLVEVTRAAGPYTGGNFWEPTSLWFAPNLFPKQ